MTLKTKALTFLGTGYTGKKQIIDYYNQHVMPLIDSNRRYRMKYADEWCATFCSAVAHMVGYRKGQFPFEVSVFYMTENAKKLGLITKNPKANDLIIYDWGNNGTLDHVGIITGVTANHISVIEGNYNDSFGQRTIAKNDNRIAYYISIPNISSKPSPSVDTPTTSNVEKLFHEVLAGKHGNGEARKKSLGTNYNAVQKMINDYYTKISINILADEVLAGKHGNGEARKKSLGRNYDLVQQEVNRRLSN